MSPDAAAAASEGRRSRGRRGVRREELLGAAVTAVREQGPGVSMERLAAAGGVTKPILYRHFGDRDGLISAIAEVYSTQLLEEIYSPLQSGTLSPREQMVATIEAYVRFVDREPNLYRFLAQQGGTRPAGGSQVSELVGTIAREVAVVIGERLREAGFDSGPAVAWSYGIIGLVHQASDWWLEDRTLPRDRLVEYLTGILWDGIAGAAVALSGGSGDTADS